MLATVLINQVQGDKAIQEQLILYKITVFPNPTCQNIYYLIPFLTTSCKIIYRTMFLKYPGTLQELNQEIE